MILRTAASTSPPPRSASWLAAEMPHRQVDMAQVGDQVRDRGVGPVDRRGRGRRLAVGPAVDDPPDPPARAVAAGVGQRDLVVADDPVVEVGDVEGPVGAQLDVHRPEPVVLAPDEVGLLDPLGRRAVPLDPVVVDPVGDDVADEDVAAIRLGELVGGVVADAGDAGRAVVVGDHLGAEPQAVVRLAEAGVPGAPQELIDRPAVAVARVEVAQRVERQAERVDLAVGDVLGVRAVGPHPVGIARVHLDRAGGPCPGPSSCWRTRGRRRSSRRSPRRRRWSCRACRGGR